MTQSPASAAAGSAPSPAAVSTPAAAALRDCRWCGLPLPLQSHEVMEHEAGCGSFGVPCAFGCFRPVSRCEVATHNSTKHGEGWSLRPLDVSVLRRSQLRVGARIDARHDSGFWAPATVTNVQPRHITVEFAREGLPAGVDPDGLKLRLHFDHEEHERRMDSLHHWSHDPATPLSDSLDLTLENDNRVRVTAGSELFVRPVGGAWRLNSGVAADWLRCRVLVVHGEQLQLEASNGKRCWLHTRGREWQLASCLRGDEAASSQHIADRVPCEEAAKVARVIDTVLHARHRHAAVLGGSMSIHSALMIYHTLARFNRGVSFLKAWMEHPEASALDLGKLHERLLAALNTGITTLRLYDDGCSDATAAVLPQLPAHVTLLQLDMRAIPNILARTAFPAYVRILELIHTEELTVSPEMIEAMARGEWECMPHLVTDQMQHLTEVKVRGSQFTVLLSARAVRFPDNAPPRRQWDVRVLRLGVSAEFDVSCFNSLCQLEVLHLTFYRTQQPQGLQSLALHPTLRELYIFCRWSISPSALSLFKHASVLTVLSLHSFLAFRDEGLTAMKDLVGANNSLRVIDIRDWDGPRADIIRTRKNCKLVTTSVGAAQLGVIKQLASLTELEQYHRGWSALALHELCSPPHRLQALRTINLTDTAVDRHIASLLANLPGLTCMEPDAFDSNGFDLLPRWPLLQTLRIVGQASHQSTFSLHPMGTGTAMADPPPSPPHRILLDSLRQLHHLTSLCIDTNGCSRHALPADALEEIPRAVPALRSLQLLGQAISSLRWLAQVPHLTELSLFNPQHRIDAAELMQLPRLVPQLRSLELSRACTLDAQQRASLTPPSLAWPALRGLKYISAD